MLLNDLDVPYKLYYSGNKGFHVGIPGTAFRWKPDINLHLKVKDALRVACVFEYADPSVTDKIRLIRVNNTKNLKANLWKRSIPVSLLNSDDIESEIHKLCNKPGEIDEIDMECDPVFDVLERNLKQNEVQTPEFISQGRSPDPVNYPCISRMLESNAQG